VVLCKFSLFPISLCVASASEPPNLPHLLRSQTHSVRKLAPNLGHTHTDTHTHSHRHKEATRILRALFSVFLAHIFGALRLRLRLVLVLAIVLVLGNWGWELGTHEMGTRNLKMQCQCSKSRCSPSAISGRLFPAQSVHSTAFLRNAVARRGRKIRTSEGLA